MIDRRAVVTLPFDERFHQVHEEVAAKVAVLADCNFPAPCPRENCPCRTDALEIINIVWSALSQGDQAADQPGDERAGSFWPEFYELASIVKTRGRKGALPDLEHFIQRHTPDAEAPRPMVGTHKFVAAVASILKDDRE